MSVLWLNYTGMLVPLFCLCKELTKPWDYVVQSRLATSTVGLDVTCYQNLSTVRLE